MLAVFQTTKQRKAVLKINLPRFLLSDPIIFSRASRTGTRPARRIIEVKGVGGHASHNKNALPRANR